MKAILEFNLPEEQSEFDLATKAGNMHAALWDIAQEVFRPARKHGYSDSVIQELVNRSDIQDDAGTELVSQLEKLFYEILEKYNIDLR